MRLATRESRLNTFRLNELPLGSLFPRVWVPINGDWEATSKVRIDSVTFVDAINDEPNTLSFRYGYRVGEPGVPPTVGMIVALVVGNGDGLWFQGNIISVQQVYESLPSNLAFDVQAIDFQWMLKKATVLRRYSNQSATAICQDLIARYAPDFGAASVAAGMPVIPEISFDEDDLGQALSRVMEAVGGYWYVDPARQVHAFTAGGDGWANTIGADDRTMTNIAQTTDLSQSSNRIVVTGGGSKAMIDRPPGADTIPVEELGWYPPGGGTVKIGPQRAYYTGVAGGTTTGSTILGDTVAVTGAPGATVVANTTGRLLGWYQYKTTWVSKEGESLASGPSGAAFAGVAPPDVVASGMVVNLWSAPTSAVPPTGTVARYVVTFTNARGETTASDPTAPSPALPPPFVDQGYTYYYTFYPQRVPIGPAGTTARKLYRSDNGGAFGLTLTINNNTATEYATGGDYEPQKGPPPLVSTAGGGQIDVSAIWQGPPYVTARNLYRTSGNGLAPFQKVGTIRDNVTTTWRDNVPDTNLGNEEPALGSLGTRPGSAGLRVSALEAFPDRGWALAGGQWIFYAGRAAASGPGDLTGIPASGTGAITAPLSVDTEVIVAPHLTGVWNILYPILAGDDVRIVVMAEDAAAQQALAAKIGFGDGVVELPLGDSSWTTTEAMARARAELARRKDPLLSVTFDSRDESIWSGRHIAIWLDHPAIGGSFLIRRVTTTGFGHKWLWPLRRVECTSQRFSFEDLLRQTRGQK